MIKQHLLSRIVPARPKAPFRRGSFRFHIGLSIVGSVQRDGWLLSGMTNLRPGLVLANKYDRNEILLVWFRPVFNFTAALTKKRRSPCKVHLAYIFCSQQKIVPPPLIDLKRHTNNTKPRYNSIKIATGPRPKWLKRQNKFLYWWMNVKYREWTLKSFAGGSNIVQWKNGFSAYI